MKREELTEPEQRFLNDILTASIIEIREDYLGIAVSVIRKLAGQMDARPDPEAASRRHHALLQAAATMYHGAPEASDASILQYTLIARAMLAEIEDHEQ